MKFSVLSLFLFFLLSFLFVSSLETTLRYGGDQNIKKSTSNNNKHNNNNKKKNNKDNNDPSPHKQNRQNFYENFDESYDNINKGDMKDYGHSMLSHFRLSPGYLNLNHGSFGATPRYVYEQQQEYNTMSEAYPDEWFRNEYFNYLDKSRLALATYLHAKSVDDIVLVENASSAVNSILRSLKLKKGDIVIYFSTAYGMVKNTCKWLEQFEGIEVIEIPVSLPFTNDGNLLYLFYAST